MIARTLAIAAIVLVTPPAQATDKETAKTSVSLKQCRAIADGARRLACYDGLADRLRGDMKPYDPVASFGGRGEKTRADRDDDAQLQSLKAKLTSVHVDGQGWLRFSIDAGSSWRQTETDNFGRMPKVGDTIEIRRGPLGSYIAHLPSGRTVRVLRVR